MPRRIIASLTITVGGISCGPGGSKIPLGSHTQVIIGTNDQAAVRQGTVTWPLRFAIGKMDNQCTAFHLGDGLVATAGHCLAKLATQSPHRSCPERSITWGLTEPGAATTTLPQSRCLEVVATKHDQDHDYAFMIVDPPPPQKLNFNPQQAWAPQATAEFYVVGYPANHSLKESGPCHLSVSEHRGEDITHDCDTLPGNSGSPIIAAASGDVIGIHNGGYDETNYGTLLQQTPLPELLNRDPIGNFRSNHTTKARIAAGPFGHNQKTLLVTFLAADAPAVSFDITTDIESGFDFVRVTDGTGNRQTLTGSDHRSFGDLKTPVTVDFVSDYGGASQAVAIDVH